MIFIDPSLEHAKREIDTVEVYAANCDSISFSQLWDALDIFAFAHFWGWGMKALMIRNYGVCWTISFTWEVFPRNKKLLLTSIFSAHRISI